MAERTKKSSLHRLTAFDYIVSAIVVLIGFVTVYPMWYVIIMSISDPVAAGSGEVTIWPIGFTLQAYSIILKEAMFWRTLGNSVIYVVSGCVLMLTTTVLMAFPLTRPNLKWRKAVTIFLLIPMYFSGGMIPSFVVITKLKMYNTMWALILPGAYGIWNIILCRTYLLSVPSDIAEAAYIDGAGNWTTLGRIYMPLSKPVLAVILIYTIVGIWNSWFASQLYQSKQEIQPVQMYLRVMLVAQSTNLTSVMKEGMTQEILEGMSRQAMTAKQLKYALIVVVTLPILLVYPMFQKHFVKGVMLGSLKG